MAEPILAAKQITKQFPGVRALNEVDFDLFPGEVHALVGENGAGKSTLIKIFGGLHRQTSGAILLNGREVHFDNPLQSQAAGISVITQEFNLVPQLTVAENIFLGREPVLPVGLVDWRALYRQSTQVLNELGVNIPSTQRVEYLSVADKQLVEISKALSHEFRIIIMDEPTAALNSAEVESLFEFIAGLRKRGVAILYVSHRLSEIFRIADRVTVLRDGQRVGTHPIQELTEEDVITMMLGAMKSFTLSAPTDEVAKKEVSATPAIRVRELSLPASLEKISFDLNYGEVLGCAGLIGSGRSELVRVLFGILSNYEGEIYINGKLAHLNSPDEALKHGIFMLPEDRKLEGIFPDLSVHENVLIKSVRTKTGLLSKLFIPQSVERNRFKEIQDFLSIRAHSPLQIISTLSGGNQQKSIFGRALVSQSRILLLNEPTRGVDVGAKMEIHQLIRNLAQDGYALLISSSDVPELVKISDRCLVLSAGKITGLLEREQLDEDNILTCAIGHAKIGVAS